MQRQSFLLAGLGALSLSLSLASAAVTDPAITSWMQNTTGLTGRSTVSAINSLIDTLPADVQQVLYTSSSSYIKASGIPDYNVGPFGSDPAYPANQHYTFDIPLQPHANTGTKTNTPLGPIGVWLNGVPVFNAEDARTYNNLGVWNQNAVVVEAADMDAALGHPAPAQNVMPAPGQLVPGAYHHHQHPVSLMAELGDDGSHPSPILGYAFDGYPIYGPYGSDGHGGAMRMTSSYQLRNVTQRHTLPDGTLLPQSEWGPDVSSQYPLGYYVQDFVYVPGSGNLDQYNGAFVVTPQYPNGTYAYFTTIDGLGNSAFPYTFGPQYYGTAAPDDLTHSVTVPADALTYSVPEPAGIALGLCALPAFFRRRR